MYFSIPWRPWQNAPEGPVFFFFVLRGNVQRTDRQKLALSFFQQSYPHKGVIRSPDHQGGTASNEKSSVSPVLHAQD